MTHDERCERSWMATQNRTCQCAERALHVANWKIVAMEVRLEQAQKEIARLKAQLSVEK
jgi:hypothetical protein